MERTDSRPLGKLDRAANEAPGDALGGRLGQGAGLWEVWEGSEVKVKDSRGVNTQQGRWLPWRRQPGSREPRMEPQRGAWRGPGPLNETVSARISSFLCGDCRVYSEPTRADLAEVQRGPLLISLPILTPIHTAPQSMSVGM